MRRLVVLMLTACSDPTPAVAPSEPPVAEPAAVAPVVEPAPEPTGPQPVIRTVNAAHFDGDELFECLEFVIEYQPPDPAPATWPAGIPDQETATNGIVEQFEEDDPAVVIQRPCTDQFRDRTPLATCVISRNIPRNETGRVPPGTVITLTSSARFYRAADVIDSDAQMRDCLRVGGDWQAIDRDSEAGREALRQDNRRQLRESVRDLQRVTH